MSNPNGRPLKFCKQKIIETYKRTKSRRKTADEIGCSDTYVFKVLKQAGIKCDGKPSQHGSKTRHTRDEVIECREKLGSAKAVAEKLGYSIQQVYHILRTPTRNNGSL